jgi:predicted Zn-ribbon and HTH transcriptional regulator
MGDIAEMILMGFLCQSCGMPIDDDAVGFPRCCEDCTSEKIENTER